MATIVGTPGVVTINTASQFVVPVGVTAGQTALIAIAWAAGTDITPTLTKAGVTFTKQGDTAAVNSRIAWWSVTGLVAGDTIVIGGTTQQVHYTHCYQDVFSVNNGTTSAGTRPGSQATTTTGSVSPASGQRVLVVAMERTTLDGTTVSSVTSSGAETVTQLTYDEDAASTDTSIYFGFFTASAAASRTATITHSSASGNGYAAAALTTGLNAGVDCKYVDGNGALQTGHMFYVDGNGALQTPAQVTWV